ncbi:type IV pili methyl-accepting chemotaxis transducer N-terminal domain-containing protein [Aquimarina sp. MMG016]|uniref:type IV pili methyl-accepting chemotaxis transducer N-terminal domain-containing protein n=1 Tax=Aquimarina sp. MMG016 TaxID=2822690 RepID=UPI001B3A7913|nr:type IV pili methyl-accepting chemotaxis transducer N-terminal domain-containing protein [Aquimarina sp. MMG016]MBQ4821080.1 type IV pili methyl-accepting chemotaxis transducer N-terminal domain-containing protein [Aquimarina sp. MMG016]
MKLKFLSILTVFILISITNLSGQSQNYGAISYSKAINVSGKQRMLSQKMSKAFLLISNRINNSEIQKELNSSKFVFKKQLEILSKNATSTTIKLSIKNVQKLWIQFKSIISSTPNLENSYRIMKLNTKLLAACDDLVTSIEQSSNYNNRFFKNENQDLISTINVSGKQRMLAQRMCLYYIANTLFQNENSEYGKILSIVYDEFDTAIGNLLISSYNTTDIEEELGNIMSIWEKFQSDRRGFMNGKFPLEEVFKITNTLTKSFNKITGIYEGISKK